MRGYSHLINLCENCLFASSEDLFWDRLLYVSAPYIELLVIKKFTVYSMDTINQTDCIKTAAGWVFGTDLRSRGAFSPCVCVFITASFTKFMTDSLIVYTMIPHTSNSCLLKIITHPYFLIEQISY